MHAEFLSIEPGMEAQKAAPTFLAPVVAEERRKHMLNLSDLGVIRGKWCTYLLMKEGSELEEAPGKGERSSYVGITNNLEKRLSEHNSSKSRATSGNKWILLAFLQTERRTEAAALEAWLKCGDSRKKRCDFFILCGLGQPDRIEDAQLFLRKALLWQAQRALRNGLFKGVR